MFTFKEFLEEELLLEGRDAPLYHGTSEDNLKEILKYNVLAAKTPQISSMFNGKKYDRYRDKHGQVWGVSLSRSLQTAKRFGRFVIELDQSKLIHRYKIVPFQWMNSELQGSGQRNHAARSSSKNKHSATEYEEFVLGSIRNVSDYIIAIHAPANLIKSDHPIFKPY